MDNHSRTKYFLGANTSAGFCSLYSELSKEAPFIWYIKGGPGNGKSTFMRTVAASAAEAGHAVDYILCSGDPDSLDGIVIRDLGVAYTDATSPHVQEPATPGGGGKYIDLSMFFKDDADFDRESVEKCFAGYRSEYARAYDLFRAAALTAPEKIPGLLSLQEIGSAYDSGRSISEQMIPEGGEYSERRRFLSAYTCKGHIACPYHAAAIYIIDDVCNLADPWLRGAADICRQKGQNMIVCPDPMTPDKTEALLLPDAGISYISSSCGRKRTRDPSGMIHPLGGSLPRSLPDLQSDIKRADAIRRKLIDMGVERLRKAKEIHDELESLYHPHVDFEALDSFTARHIRTYLK